VASFWAPKPINEDLTIAPRSLKDAVVLPFVDFIDRKKKAGGAAILMFILTYKLGDYMVKSVAKLFLKDIGFSTTDIASTGSIGIIAAIIGAICGGLIMLKIGMNRSLWIAAIGLSIGILPYEILAQIHQPDLNLLLLAVSVESFAAGLEAAVFVAFLTSLCKPRFSATQFALFSSFMLAGRSLIIGPMGGIYQSLGSVSFFWISILAAIPSLMLLLYVAPLNIKSLINSGLKAKANNDLNSAIDYFSHAIDLSSRNSIAYKERGLIGAELGHKFSDRGSSYSARMASLDYYQDAIDYYRSAIEDCDKASEINPTTNDVSEDLIKILQGTNETLDRTIELDNSNANTYAMRAKIRNRLGDLPGAISDLQLAIQLDPRQPEFAQTLARIQSS
jgi:tetratricopeptide (TPR) repeat protein